MPKIFSIKKGLKSFINKLILNVDVKAVAQDNPESSQEKLSSLPKEIECAKIKHGITYIDVPYAEKEQAKKLGARWDPLKSSWFISNALDHSQFVRWLPVPVSVYDINMRSSYFYLAESKRDCFRCNKSISVYAIILPDGFEHINSDMLDFFDKRGTKNNKVPYSKRHYSSIVSYVSYISPKALESIYKIVDESYFTKRFSKIAKQNYFMNICQHCHAGQGDFFLIEEFSTPFWPRSEEAQKKLVFHKILIDIKIFASGHSAGYDPLYADHVRIML